MLQEALVIFACINSTGCQETSGHYFNTHPEVRQIAKYPERIAKKYVGPYVVESIGPLIYMAAGGTGTIRLHRNWSLQLSKETGTLSYRWEF